MVSQIYTAAPNDVITAARWNNEFGNIYNNGTTVAFPLTTAVSFNGQTITLDAAGATTLSSSANVALSVTPGAKAGTPGTGANSGNILNIAASTFTDTNTAASGTAAEFSSVSIQRPTLAASNTLVTTTDAATLYINNAPAAGTNETITNAYALWIDNGTLRTDGGLTGTVALGKHIEGMIQSNDGSDATNDIDISAGTCTSWHATPASRVLLMTGALVKRLDASWVTGTNQGGLSSSLAIANTDYWIHAIRVAGVDDVGFDTSFTAANLVTDHAVTHYRPIGWIRRTGGAIVAFTANEEPGGALRYTWTTQTLDIDLANTLTTARRTDAVRVPLTLSTIAKLRLVVDDAAALAVIVQCPDEADVAPSLTAAPLCTARSSVAGVEAIAEVFVKTSAAGLIAARVTANTMDSYRVVTVNFLWSRT